MLSASTSGLRLLHALLRGAAPRQARAFQPCAAATVHASAPSSAARSAQDGDASYPRPRKPAGEAAQRPGSGERASRSATAAAPSRRRPGTSPGGDSAAPGKGPNKPPPTARPSASKQRGGPLRVAKALADAGVASRRASEALVFAGRVRVNGTVCMVPQTPVTPGVDSVEVDGAVVQLAAAAVRHYYFALYKPAGYVCTNAREGDKVVLDLFTAWLEKWKERAQQSSVGQAAKPQGGAPKAPPGAAVTDKPRPAAASKAALPPRLFTVGRLDTATSGLILVTNDGTWAQRIAHPSSGISKEYIVTAADTPTKRQLVTMAEGCLVEGVFVKPLRVEKVLTPDGGSPNRVLVELCDGRNHEVRLLCAQAGVDVKHLKRVRVGGIRLPSSLKPGQFQELTFKDAKQVVDVGAQEEARGGSLARVLQPDTGAD